MKLLHTFTGQFSGIRAHVSRVDTEVRDQDIAHINRGDRYTYTAEMVGGQRNHPPSRI